MTAARPVATPPARPIAYPPPAGPPEPLDGIVTLADFEPLAQARLHPAAWAFYSGGAWNEVTLRENRAAWERYHLLPRVLLDPDPVDLSTTLLGAPVALPVGIAPSALHGMAHPDGEIAMARAAATAGVIAVISTPASRTIEEVAAGAPDARRWFQLYAQPDPDVSRDLVRRAAAAGYQAIVLTVDLPILGYRDDILRLDFDPGPEAYGNLPNRPRYDSGLDEVVDHREAHLTWAGVDEIRSWSDLPLVLKGILTPEDARLAVDHGAAAVWVSNHGGRQLDRTPAPIDVVPEIVEAVGGRAEIYLDGGVRRGTDVATALAAGADAVFTARPFLYALATAGQAGVERALAILREETWRAFVLLGARTPADLGPQHLRRR